ncbi:MAG: hypothetical protein LBQ79_10695 [Deltaproteobacteria bacterium]|jgi:ribonuclease J|nr:hypothetical protein [Deltaproteobacteria bacterium]
MGRGDVHLREPGNVLPWEAVMQLKFHRSGGKNRPTTIEFRSGTGTRVFIDLGNHGEPGSGGTDIPLTVPGLTAPDPEGGRTGSALFISHLHLDHSGRLEDALPEVPVFCGPSTWKFMDVLNEHRIGRLEKDLGRGGPTRAGGDTLEGRLRRRKALAAVKFFEGLKPIRFDDIEIRPVMTDHSCPDTYMFLVREGEELALVSGDFMDHGLKRAQAEYFMGDLAKDAHWLVCSPVFGRGGKGESAPKGPFAPERDVEESVYRIMKEKPLTLAICSSTGIDRIHSLVRANGRAGRDRLFLADRFQKEILDIASGFRSPDRGMLPYGFSGKLRLLEGNEAEKDFMAWKERGFLMLVRGGRFFSPYLERFLGVPGGDAGEEGAVLIYSRWEGYRKTGPLGFGEGDEVSLQVPKDRIRFAHTGGHASPEALRRFADRFCPEAKLVPIECSNAGELVKVFPEKGRVRKLEPGEYLLLNG